jgi:hypothetical protein
LAVLVWVSDNIGKEAAKARSYGNEHTGGNTVSTAQLAVFLMQLGMTPAADMSSRPQNGTRRVKWEMGGKTRHCRPRLIGQVVAKCQHDKYECQYYDP